MLTTMTLRSLAKRVGIETIAPANYPSKLDLQSPIPDQIFVIDESINGEECIIDGRKRFFQIFLQASREIVSWDIEIGVRVLNFKKIINSTLPQELSDLPNGILNADYIKNFLLLKQTEHSEMHIHPEKITDLTRKIYRHLLNNLSSTHSNPVGLVSLVAELDGYLKQSDIAKILRRSEGWVSDTLAVSKLPPNIFASMESGQISYSAAVVIARAGSEKERDMLFALAKKLDVRSLRDALRFLITKPKFSDKKDAFDKLYQMFSKKVLDVGGRARFQLQTGVERSLRKFFRSRMNQSSRDKSSEPGKDPQSLVFRLKITIDGENAEDMTRISPEKVSKLRKSILETLKLTVSEA